MQKGKKKNPPVCVHPTSIQLCVCAYWLHIILANEDILASPHNKELFVGSDIRIGFG